MPARTINKLTIRKFRPVTS